MIYAIVGMGRSGEAARRFLLRTGIPEESIVSFDGKPGAARYHDPETMFREHRIDCLVVSPGVPLSLPWIVEASRRGVEVTSEISLAVRELGDERIIGVTGSVGKSTTVALLYEGAKTADRHAFLGGNFGIPLCDYVSDVLEGKRPRAEWLLLELSSFQLENCEGLKLDIAAITSLTANHLERYADKDHYYVTKWAITRLCRGPVYLNAHGGDLLDFAKGRPGNWVAVDRRDPFFASFHLEDSALLGAHNRDNLAVAISVAMQAGWDERAVRAMKAFPGLSHRLENLGSFGGVRMVNDSKATALDSVKIAVRSCLDDLKPDSRLFLLLGGKDKNLPWEELGLLATEKNLQPIFFGQCGGVVQQRSGLNGRLVGRLSEAVDLALKHAADGDTILLSPGGTSLDEFRNFEERGRFFSERVRAN